MRAVVFGIVVVASFACRKPSALPSAFDGADPLAALSAPLADPMRGRFSFKIASEPLGLKGSTGGAIIVDRPGRLHFAVLGPLGGALATAQTDGDRASIVIRRDAQHYWADAVEDEVRTWTDGQLGVDGVVGMFLGRVPMPDPAEIESTDDGGLAYEERGLRVKLSGLPLLPEEVRIVESDGTERLTLRYTGFENTDAGLLPTGWSLSVPALELALDVKFKSFEAIETAPDVFGTEAPVGFSSAPWADVARALAAPR